MKLAILASTLGATLLLLGTAWTSLGKVRAIGFTPPSDNSAPRQGSGGASRSGFSFTPPSDNRAPRQGSGGASRTGFTPPSDNRAPRQGSGGASRTGFTPPSDNRAPRQGAGGASRDGFTPPPDNATPQQTAGGSSRTPSPTALYLGVQPLVPQSYYGTTLQEHPTILVYMPTSNAREVIFSLKDEQKNLVYQMVVPTTGEAGVISLQLPETAPPLEVGQNYQWYIALKLDGELTPRSPFVDGWIQRIEPSPELAQSLKKEDALEVAAALGANGVWYDCVATLASLRSVQPMDRTLFGHWQELLGSVGLENITLVPLVVSSQPLAGEQ
jgi:Domain of Unknown Function (DUF928)